MDTDKLTKLLNLTTSDNDHEALSAIRMANKMVGGSWDGVISKTYSKTTNKAWQPEPFSQSFWDRFTEKHHNTGWQAPLTIEKKIAFCMEYWTNEEQLDVLSEIERMYEDHELLTADKMTALNTIYEFIVKEGK